MQKTINIIISGGGTGGHIFPAISIANSIKELLPNANILFVGAENKMEMEKVPAAGYKIEGLPVSGFDRSSMKKNITFVSNLLRSLKKAKKIIKDFKPDIVVGVGGFASGPTLFMANRLGIPTVIQEQNSYAGVTNKLLAKKAKKICVAYDNMDKFFPANKIVLTGNPIRQQLLENADQKENGYQFFGLSHTKKTILIIGGSLGARTINQSILKDIKSLLDSNIQVIWQTGKFYINDIKAQTAHFETKNMIITDFVARMDLAYSIADLVVSRAGASSISELSLLQKPCILVPSPNVAEDHQTKNALALSEKNAAIMISDMEASNLLVNKALSVVKNQNILGELSTNIAHFAKPDASRNIALEILKLLGINNLPKTTEATKKKKINNYYFLGIGGIGMSALARYFKQHGCQVGGYDLTKTTLTEELEKEGIEIHYKDSISLIPLTYMSTDSTTIVYTPAIPKDLQELVFFQKGGFRLLKRSEILGEITRSQKALCVSGTHGKTTTSTMIAHIFTQSKIGASAFLGGISKNYNSNLLVNTTSPFVVVEADEYDRSFHQLSPYMAVVTATDADHLDIYNDRNNLLQSFAHFTSLIQEGGVLLAKEGIDLIPELAKNVKLYTYSGTKTADFYAKNITTANGKITFDFVTPTETISSIELGVPILINVENSVAAMSIAYLNGITPEEIKKAIASFEGIKRRFDVQVKTDKVTFIDDYAHHPEELKASINSIKALYPDKKICGIFQPHLYTRTRDFANEFAESLSILDSVILLDIYPAREKPIEGITSNIILSKINCAEKKICKKENLLDEIKTSTFDVLITLGAGDIDKLVPEIANYLKTNEQSE